MADTANSAADLETSTQKRRKLSPEELEALNRRVYEDSMSHKKRNLENIENKVYRTEAPKKLDQATIDASVQRQVNDEMERRKRRTEELKRKFEKEGEAKTLAPAEIEDSVRRIYTDAMRVKQDKLAKLDAKYGHKGPERKQIDSATVKACGDRLAKPKKREYTDEEINKIYGF